MESVNPQFEQDPICKGGIGRILGAFCKILQNGPGKIFQAGDTCRLLMS
jgi:hypothetical protein